MPRTPAPDLSPESTMTLDEAAAGLLRGRVKVATLRAAGEGRAEVVARLIDAAADAVEGAGATGRR